MATIQTPKTRIDTGVPGSPSTGDILYDGGNFLNENFNNVYNAFADQRLFSMGTDGAGHQVLHATGYYQKKAAADYINQAVEIGSMHDLSLSSSLTVTLPKGKKGEGVVFVNFDRSITNKAVLTIKCESKDNIIGAGKQLIVTTPGVRVELWGSTKDEATGNIGWNYKVSSLYGDTVAPIDKHFQIPGNGASFVVAHVDQFKAIKLLTTAESTGSESTIKFKTAEVMLHVDKINKKVYSTEYAVVKDKDDFYDTSYKIDASTDQVVMTVTPKTNNVPIRFVVKAIATTSMTTVAENPGA
ncbi:baseplate wedge tail fiber protein connector [Serratia phage 92A1]|nr:baseplate wedge tail fiber protein connector [Serratia phage 92A1]